MDMQQHTWWEQAKQDPNAVILDVRTDDECALGIIPDAIQLDIYKAAEFMEGLEQMDKSNSYYVYCKAGGRSAQACQIMKSMGFSKTYNLAGGFSSWKGPVQS
jgi:rhodanese-related sulfurtransferase